MNEIKTETNDKVIAPAGLSRQQAKKIVALIDNAEKIFSCLTIDRAQKIVDSLEKINVDKAAIIYTVDQLRAILRYGALGAVGRLTCRACDVILEIARQKNLPDNEFTKITRELCREKCEACSKEMDILECYSRQRNFRKNLLAINQNLIPGKKKPYGWIKVDNFYIRTIPHEILINMNVASVDINKNKKTMMNVINFQVFHKINCLESDAFLKENDPEHEIKRFIKKVILSINSYNGAHNDSIVSFSDNKYDLLVMQRYPKETRQHTIIHKILIEKNKYDRFAVVNV